MENKNTSLDGSCDFGVPHGDNPGLGGLKKRDHKGVLHDPAGS